MTALGWWTLMALLQAPGPGSDAAGEFQPLDLMVRESDTSRPPERVGLEEARYDLRLLAYALEHAYGGRRFVPEEDFTRARRQLSLLAEQPPRDPLQLCDSIADALWLIPDNHLSASAGVRRCGKESLQQRRRPAVGGNVAAKSAPESAWALSRVEVAGRTVPVLSVTRFPTFEDPAWNGFSEAVAGLRGSPAVIVDLRGNGGGDDRRGVELAEVLLGGEAGRPYDATITRQTPGAFLLLANPLRITQLVSRRRGEELPGYLIEDLEESLRRYEEALAGRLPPERIDEFAWGPPEITEASYRNPVLLVADAACGSSCEDTLLFLRGLPGAVTVGEATGGYLHFGDLGCVILPHSQLRVNLPTKYFRIPDAYYERRGIEPDVRVPAGEDALEAAVRWLEEYFSARREGG